MYDRGPKYIWVHTATDQHWGGRAKEFITSSETGKRLGMAEAVFEIMRREGLCEKNRMPVHLFSTNDDPTQGQNFPARVQPDPLQRSYRDLEGQFLRTFSEMEKEKKIQQMRTVSSYLRIKTYHEADCNTIDLEETEFISFQEPWSCKVILGLSVNLLPLC